MCVPTSLQFYQTVISKAVVRIKGPQVITTLMNR